MTLEEKIGQMNQYSSFFDITGPAPKESGAKIKYNDIRSGSVGSVLNVVSAKEVRAMQKFVVANSQFGWYVSLYKKPCYLAGLDGMNIQKLLHPSNFTWSFDDTKICFLGSR